MANNQRASIFNDVIGPVMTGPSSSHTAGPTRIGKLARDLIKGNLKKAKFEFDSKGSFSATYRGQKSDMGFVGGLLGWETGDARISTSLMEAEKKGIEVTFLITSFQANHPNTARITLESDEEKINITASSVGGGMVEITEVNGFPVSMKGDFYELMINCNHLEIDQMEKLVEKIKELGVEILFCHTDLIENKGLINIKTRETIADDILLHLESVENITSVRLVNPVLPVLSTKEFNLPFRTGEELLKYVNENNLELWEAAAHYESARSGWSVEEVLEYMKKIILIMKESIEKGLAGDFEMRGFLGKTAGSIEKTVRTKKIIPTGALDKAIAWSTAVMEYNNSMGVVVAAPTAGSCGILPGVILSSAEAMGLGIEEQTKAMIVAGAIGILISEQATFAGEVGACQAEIGSASSMAAAGLVQLADGTPKQALEAATLAMQNSLGLVCDPVAGLVDIPCINRNAMGAGNAATSANMVLGGFDPYIPIDEVIVAMYDVGKMLPRELKCTSIGGLCATKTGKRIAMEFSKRVD